MDLFELIRKGRIKRYFRATGKLNIPNLVSYITQRATGKEPLFLEDKDYLFMLGLLKEIAERYAIRVYAFCLMPNHVHLLLSPREMNLYDATRDLFSRYAMKFNRKYERKGHLFGGPYRQAVCIDDSYLLAASLYIHLNPAKSGLIDDPMKYRWSSCRLYSEQAAPKSFIDNEFVLSMLSRSMSEATKRYQRLLRTGVEIETARVLEQPNAIEDFRSNLISMFPALLKWVGKSKRVSGIMGMDLPSMEELDRQIEAVRRAGIPDRPEGRKAKRYLIEQLIARGYKRSEIAEKLSMSRKTLYNLLKC